ncbi:MAG: 4Fe-4S ferredoxin [Spirochaetota bacterium]
MNEFSGCPGSRTLDLREKEADNGQESSVAAVKSELRQWPIQLHLVNPMAPYFQGADVILTADCVAYAFGGFHSEYLKGKTIAIACPKLDDGQEVYTEKIRAWIDEAQINTLTVITMEVPCCGGLLQMAMDAASKAERKVPVKNIIIGLKGDKLQERWVPL